MDDQCFSFIVYMIHACADRWDMSPARVYQALIRSDCLEHYLIPNYEILHTQSTNYIVHDIEEYLKEREVTA